MNFLSTDFGATCVRSANTQALLQVTKHFSQSSDKPCQIWFVVLHLGKRQETNLDKVRQDSFLVPEDQRCRATQMNMVTQFREGAKAQHMAPVEGGERGFNDTF